MSEANRELTDHERRLVRWMLEHGSPEAAGIARQALHELSRHMPAMKIPLAEASPTVSYVWRLGGIHG